MNEENTQEGLSLKDIFKMFRAHWIGILVATIIGVVGGLGIGLTTPPQYQASQKVYILNSGDGDSSGNVTNSSQEIVDGLRLIYTFIDFIKDSEVAREAVSLVKSVAENPDNNLDINTENLNYKQIVSGLSASTSDENTLCVTISYTHTDSLTAKVILENVILAARSVSSTAGTVTMFNGRIQTSTPDSKMGFGECADVVKTSRGTSLYLGLGLAVGLVVGVAYAIIRELLDNTIKEKNYVENKYKLKVIGSIPEFVEEVNNEKK